MYDLLGLGVIALVVFFIVLRSLSRDKIEIISIECYEKENQELEDLKNGK